MPTCLLQGSMCFGECLCMYLCITWGTTDVLKRKLNVCALASQVGFRDYKAVLKTKVEERVNAIVNRLNGTKRDVPHPDLPAEREAYEKEVRRMLLQFLTGL